MRTALLTLTIAALCLAQDDKPIVGEILLHNGTEVRGEILDVDRKTGIKIKTANGIKTIPLRKVDAYHFYNLLKSRIPNDAKSRLNVARYCYENGLFSQARYEYRKAGQLDAKVVEEFEKNELPKIKEELAKSLIATAKRHAAKDDYVFAERALAEILTEMSETKAADEARMLIAHYYFALSDKDEQARMKKARSQAQQDKRDEKQLEKARERVVDPIARKIESAQSLALKGLRKKNSSQSRSTLESAVKKFESALKSIASARKQLEKNPDPVLSQHLDELEKVAKREAVETYIHIGSIYMIRRDYKNSLHAANMAASIDSESEYAKEFQSRVVSEAQVRQGWGRGGR
jgi:tetratricopeptide (TPR) repeat protein